MADRYVLSARFECQKCGEKFDDGIDARIHVNVHGHPVRGYEECYLLASVPLAETQTWDSTTDSTTKKRKCKTAQLMTLMTK